ncbi:MAG: 30S ribosomal protein S20 [Deltaproteobacteria bacterium]|nr:30S ribosomal protein S20 [Deltaproteobacteria bacterium]
MANHPSALKRDRQRQKKQARNRSSRSAVRSQVAAARAVLGTDNGPEAVKVAASSMARAAQKGALGKRAAARKIGRLARALYKAQAAAKAAGAERPSKAPKPRASKAPKAPKRPSKAPPAEAAPATKGKKTS